MVARFKKKEEIGRMTKSILKHKIQTLTGRSIKKLEEEMGYQAKDPNEPSMDIDTMRSLASSLVLLARCRTIILFRLSIYNLHFPQR